MTRTSELASRPLTIVTGASRGIGSGIALELGRGGHDLALVALTQRDKLDEIASSARELGSAVSTHLGDVSIEPDVTRIFAEATHGGRRLTGLVNNAAYVGERGDMATASVDAVDRILAVNVRGTILMSRAAIGAMAAGGVIVNVSSQSAVFGGNGLSVYAASKAAINGLTISLAREVAPKGIRVVAISPGPVLTDPLMELPPERLRDMEAGLPMGRFCTREEVGRVVAWLMSADASYVSGTIVPIHGAR